MSKETKKEPVAPPPPPPRPVPPTPLPPTVPQHVQPAPPPTPQTVTVRFNGKHPELVSSLAKLLGAEPISSFAYPAMSDKTLRPVTILEFQASSAEEAKHFAELLNPILGVELVA